MIVGIDATNIRAGGGLTHLKELLTKASPYIHEFDQIIVWAGRQTLNEIPEKKWIIKRHNKFLDMPLLFRVYWQTMTLEKMALREECDILFVPGGSFFSTFRPLVTMSQNLLPFEIKELLRFGFSFMTLKLLVLRFSQSRSLRLASGVIFLTSYARCKVKQVVGGFSGRDVIIHHGINKRFNDKPKLQRSIIEYNHENLYRILYVSTIDFYKHQQEVIIAMEILRNKGFPVALDLVGSSNPRALKKLTPYLNKSWVRYHGSVSFEELHEYYKKSDLGIFASSCENLPNILIEMMASGLPIVCSKSGPMPEILGLAGLYFDPDDALDISDKLELMINSPNLREEFSRLSYSESKKFSWKSCADETFKFLNFVCNEYKRNSNVQK